MTKGVLLYCFDTDEVKYHRFLIKCVRQIETFLKLPITVVTNSETHNFVKHLDVGFRIIENRKGNTRYYRGKNISWHNLERVNALSHSPYDQTILMDIDYFCFSDNLLKYLDTDYDFLVHNKVLDITGKNVILGTNESVLPIVWATVIIFRKCERTERIFALVKHIQQNYEHYRNLYRIRHRNYRNDFAFAVALHQMNGMIPVKNFIPAPMFMLPHEYDVLDIDDSGLMFRYDKRVGYLQGIDVHLLDKEFVNGR